MSSPPKENLKAGHPPAVKVSGMRVVQHSHNHSDKLTKEEREKEELEFQTEKPVNESLVVGGAIAKGDKDFSTAAVKVAHEKPMPSKEKHQKGWSAHGHPNIVLMQPGKQPVNESLVVGGAIAKGDKDFSTAAVKVAHEKPMPSKEKHQKGWSAHGHPNIVLMQPGKQPVNESLVVGGAIAKGDKDFSTAAVKVAHEKPMPSKEKHQKGWSAHGHPNIVLMQPGKQ